MCIVLVNEMDSWHRWSDSNESCVLEAYVVTAGAKAPYGAHIRKKTQEYSGQAKLRAAETREGPRPLW